MGSRQVTDLLSRAHTWVWAQGRLIALLSCVLALSGPIKALVWFWLIDETLSANLVYQSDYEIGSTTPSDKQ